MVLANESLNLDNNKTDIDKFGQRIEALVARPLYDLDMEGLPTRLLPLLKDTPSIKAISITENIDDESVFRFYRDNQEKIIFNQELPEPFGDSIKQSIIPVSYHDEKVGTLFIYHEEDTSSISFSHEEKLWLKNNTLKVGIESWAPILFFENNQAKGLVGDILNLVIKKTGLKVKLLTGNWKDLLMAFEQKKIDLLPDSYYSTEREQLGIYGKAYFSVREHIYLKKNNHSIKFLSDLSHKKLAVINASATITAVKDKYPDIQVIGADNFSQLVQLVLSGEADAFIDAQIISEAFFQEHSITGLKGIAQFEIDTNKLHFFSQPDQPVLYSILEKGLNSISKKEKNDIVNKWLAQSNQLNLSDEEQTWLDKKTPIRYVYDPDWAPFEWTNDVGKHAGIISDLLKLIEIKSSLNLIPVETKSWADAITFAKNRRADMFSGVGITEDRKTYMNFSEKNIFSTSYIFVSRLDEDYLAGFAGLENKKIAVVGGYTIHGILKNNRPDLPLILLQGTQEGFDKLLANEIDVFLVNSVTAKYFTRQEKYQTLKLTYKTNYSLDLKVAIRNDWPPEVISIFNKAIAAISEKELADIYHKWTEVKVTTTIDYSLMYKVAAVLVVLILLIIFWNRRLNALVNVKTKDLAAQNQIVESQKLALEKLLFNFDKNVIASNTDENGIITYVSQAFCEISRYKQEELLGQSHSIVRHPDMPKSLYAGLWATIKSGQTWQGEIKNRCKNGDYYWVDAIISPEFDNNGKLNGYSAIRQDISAKKEVEDLSKNLEMKVDERTKDLAIAMKKLRTQKEFTTTLLDSQEQIVITTDGRVLKTCNKEFLEFFKVKTLDDFTKDYRCICDRFNSNAPVGYIQKEMQGMTWIDFIIQEPNKIHKVMISIAEQDYIFSVTGAVLASKDNLKSAIFSNITELEKAQQKVEEMHKHTQDSIEYAALIQSTLIPDKKVFYQYFKDFFAIWHPKDIVGGDIYLAEALNEDEWILMVIDCTGHGVPGAFVTMLVKAVERQLIANLQQEAMISPAKILSIFNKSIKHLLKQENMDSISNAGFDGGILYYNKKEKIVRFSGAETPLFVFQNEELKTIKGNRHSIGYKKSDANYEFTDHTFDVSQPTQFYLSTDGYFDQNGGAKGFPFGKKRFKKLIQENANESFADQQELLLYELQQYQQDHLRNDDVTVIGIKI